jgi:hypothetical protein
MPVITGLCKDFWTLLSLSWKLVSSLDFQGLYMANFLGLGFAVTAVVALILNLSLPYDVEDDTVAIRATDADAQVATFTEHDTGVEMSKQTPEVAEKNVEDLAV